MRRVDRRTTDRDVIAKSIVILVWSDDEHARAAHRTAAARHHRTPRAQRVWAQRRSAHRTVAPPLRASAATAAAPGPAMVASVGRQRAVYSRVAAFGLLLLAAAPIMLLIVSVASGMALGAEGPFLAVAAVVPLIAAALAWRYGTWSKIVAIIVALLAAGGLFWLAFGLAFPASFGDFVPGLSFVLGFVLALGGGIAALVQGRRRNLAAAATTGERRIILGAGALLAFAMVVSGIMTVLAGRAAADADGTPVARRTSRSPRTLTPWQLTHRPHSWCTTATGSSTTWPFPNWTSMRSPCCPEQTRS